MLRRIVWLLIAFPAGLLLVTLAVANRHDVRLALDPFHPEAPVLSLVLPFYAYLFAAHARRRRARRRRHVAEPGPMAARRPACKAAPPRAGTRKPTA